MRALLIAAVIWAAAALVGFPTGWLIVAIVATLLIDHKLGKGADHG